MDMGDGAYPGEGVGRWTPQTYPQPGGKEVGVSPHQFLGATDWLRAEPREFDFLAL